VFVIFILILLAIMMGILSAIYSVFAPFMQNIGNVVNFNSSYYWALAGVERAYLVLKYKQPGFEWSGWFLKSTTFGPKSDILTWNFWILTNENNWFAWSISSRTREIPGEWQGNVDYLLTHWTDSKNYNKLPYYSSEKIILSIDTTSSTDMYYTGVSSIAYYSGWSFTWIIRLPPKAQQQFDWKGLCDTCDTDEDGISDDIMVNWILDGKYNWTSFAIVPSMSVLYYSWWIIDSTRDIAIREKVINDTGFLDFWNVHLFSPLVYPNVLIEHNVLSLDADSIKGISFNDLLDWSSPATDLKLWLWIINLLRTEDDDIYPFLEYKFSFPRPVSDSFFTLQGIGLVGDYNVKIFIKKSTNEQSSIGDFTIIF
jgi:hypothetical protein